VPHCRLHHAAAESRVDMRLMQSMSGEVYATSHSRHGGTLFAFADVKQFTAWLARPVRNCGSPFGIVWGQSSAFSKFKQRRKCDAQE
jgi:hypothetical protein